VPYPIPVPVSRHRWSRPGELDIVDGSTSYTQRALRRAGLRGYQPATTAALLAAWETYRKPTFLDVGANGGLYATLCAKIFARSTVVAFEPAPAIANAVRAIATANQLAVEVEQVAVSDTAGTATLYLSKKSDASNSLTKGFRVAKGAVEVPTLPLDEYVAEHELQPDVIKIDVERHEIAVLDGAEETLRRHRPACVIEILPGDPADEHEIKERMSDLGYRVARLEASVTKGAQEDPALRDWLCWPAPGPPRGFVRRLRAWERAVARCVPGAEHNTPARQSDQFSS
jgi:FkbM family methyltransferase